MDKRLERWMPNWSKNAHEMPFVKEIFGRVERSYQAERARKPDRQYQPEEIIRLMRKSPLWKQGGAGNISIAFCRNMPEEAILDLIEIYQDMDRYAVSPVEIVMFIIALISTLHLGERPIGVIIYIYGLSARLHKIRIDEWEPQTRVEWDTAVQGNSALQAALKRMLFDGVALASEQVLAENFIDIKYSMTVFRGSSLSGMQYP